MSKATLDAAIKILTAKYQKALTNPNIKEPLAYALYHTWRMVDAQAKGAKHAK